MSHSVDNVSALEVLTKAAQEASQSGYKTTSACSAVIEQVITGSHLTYRYILMTALLAKATNPKINPLAIQANARIRGAYDARSLCHTVIVKNQRELLRSGLGDSNEPYLNKPARTPFLDKSNPVRGGNDRRTLEALCDTLPMIDTRDKAYAALCDAVHFAICAVESRMSSVAAAIGSAQEKPTDVRAFLNTLLTKTHHGEATVLVTALLYWLLSKYKGEGWTIEVHPVNEAGSSSNQIGDIDVYRGQDLIYTCEVKDKSVAAADIHHAILKASAARSQTLHIVFGPKGQIVDADHEQLQTFAMEHKIALTIFGSTALVEASAIWTPASLSLGEIASKSFEIAEVARMKQESRDFLLETIQSFAAKSKHS